MADQKDNAQATLKNLSIQAGQRYQHFKGGEYEIVAVAVQEDTLEPLVIYHSVTNNSVWARTYLNFTEAVDRDDYQGKRFVLIS